MNFACNVIRIISYSFIGFLASVTHTEANSLSTPSTPALTLSEQRLFTTSVANILAVTNHLHVQAQSGASNLHAREKLDIRGVMRGTIPAIPAFNTTMKQYSKEWNMPENQVDVVRKSATYLATVAKTINIKVPPIIAPNEIPIMWSPEEENIADDGTIQTTPPPTLQEYLHGLEELANNCTAHYQDVEKRSKSGFLYSTLSTHILPQVLKVGHYFWMKQGDIKHLGEDVADRQEALDMVYNPAYSAPQIASNNVFFNAITHVNPNDPDFVNNYARQVIAPHSGKNSDVLGMTNGELAHKLLTYALDGATTLQQKEWKKRIEAEDARQKQDRIIHQSASQAYHQLPPLFMTQEDQEKLAPYLTMLKNPFEYFHSVEDNKNKQVLLFTGPPGVGKTLTAQAMAAHAQTPFFSLSAKVFSEEKAAERLSDFIATVDAYALKYGKSSAVILIDEGHLTGATTRDHGMTGGNIALRVQLDFFERLTAQSNPGVMKMIIICTNKPEALDSAATRSGRVNGIIPFSLPTPEVRNALLKNAFPHFSDEEIQNIVKSTDTISRNLFKDSDAAGIPSEEVDAVVELLGHFSQAELIGIKKRAYVNAAYKGHGIQNITPEDYEEALKYTLETKFALIISELTKNQALETLQHQMQQGSGQQ